jgi:hypothetical protein
VAALPRAPARWHHGAGAHSQSLLLAPLLLLALLAPLSVAAQEQGAGFVSPPLYGSQPAPSFADQLAAPFYTSASSAATVTTAAIKAALNGRTIRMAASAYTLRPPAYRVDSIIGIAPTVSAAVLAAYANMSVGNAMRVRAQHGRVRRSSATSCLTAHCSRAPASACRHADCADRRAGRGAVGV